jgi:hypothetical protein
MSALNEKMHKWDAPLTAPYDRGYLHIDWA